MLSALSVPSRSAAAFGFERYTTLAAISGGGIVIDLWKHGGGSDRNGQATGNGVARKYLVGSGEVGSCASRPTRMVVGEKTNRDKTRGQDHDDSKYSLPPVPAGTFEYYQR